MGVNVNNINLPKLDVIFTFLPRKSNHGSDEWKGCREWRWLSRILRTIKEQTQKAINSECTSGNHRNYARHIGARVSTTATSLLTELMLKNW